MATKPEPFTEEELVKQGYSEAQAKRMVFLESHKDLPEVPAKRPRRPRKPTTENK